jgi:hypothetical protein
MKALSIKQPWASLIAHGIKDIENRTWRTNFRGRIFIHASAKQAGSYDELLNDIQKNDFKVMYDNITLGKQHHFSAIIGEVDIIDCVVNHPSIWAEQSIEVPIPTPADYSWEKYLTTNQYEKDIAKWERNKGIKPIYNWVLANPVLYDKPILNVKGKLSFWEWHGCEQTCESCEKDFDIDNMQRDGDDNYFCKLCADELFPIMQAEYEEMVAKGEIEPDDD